MQGNGGVNVQMADWNTKVSILVSERPRDTLTMYRRCSAAGMHSRNEYG